MCNYLRIAPDTIRCKDCLHTRTWTRDTFPRRECPSAPPGKACCGGKPAISPVVEQGPGTELKKILWSLNINPSPKCDCNKRAAQMNEWGIAGCREHFQEIVGWMREGQHEWGWQDKLAAAGRAVKTGLAFQINWLDPFPSIIEQAIEAAERRTNAAE